MSVPPLAEVTFVDVGQGNATLARSEGGGQMLIDCPSAGSQQVLARTPIGDAITAIVVSHRDLDHCGGVPALLRNRHVDTLYMNTGWAIPPDGASKSKIRAVLRDIHDLCTAHNVQMRPMVAGDSGTIGNISWHALAPDHSHVFKAALTDRSNESSIVLRLDAGKTDVLVTGDIEGTPATALADQTAVRARVLQVPHHGANQTSLEALVDHAKPSVAVISAGRSDGRHPTNDTLEILRSRALRIACTQVNRLCHAAELTDAQCAGDVTVRIFAARMTVTPRPRDHSARISALDTPRCT